MQIFQGSLFLFPFHFPFLISYSSSLPPLFSFFLLLFVLFFLFFRSSSFSRIEYVLFNTLFIINAKKISCDDCLNFRAPFYTFPIFGGLQKKSQRSKTNFKYFPEEFLIIKSLPTERVMNITLKKFVKSLCFGVFEVIQAENILREFSKRNTAGKPRSGKF